MAIKIDGWAWIPKNRFASPTQLQALKAALTIRPKKVGDHPGDPPKPIYLYEERDEEIGVARQYFLQRRRLDEEVTFRVSVGEGWRPGLLPFNGRLREEQEKGVIAVTDAFRKGLLGGIVRAPCGYGKTVLACAVISRMNVPTLVVLHKEFLINQWRERIEQFLPEAKIGYVQQDRCDFEGKQIVLGMVHSLAGRDYGRRFYEWPGLIISDECHRIGAKTWSGVPAKFPAKWRLGITATPRRKDGADNVFTYQIGKVIFAARETQLKARVRRVWSTFQLVKTPSFNPRLAPRALVIRFLCSSPPRNTMIVEQLVLALKAGRKILVLSELLKHLDHLSELLRRMWDEADGPVPSIGFYVGGMSETALNEAAARRCIFATKQMACEGLDIPELDTLVLATPMGDIEQARGRILRPVYRMGEEVEKKPIVVDIRDDRVPKFKRLGEARDRQYLRLGDT